MGFLSVQEQIKAIKEVRVLKTLDHYNIIQVFDVFPTKRNKLCIVMMHAEDGNLKKRIAN